MPFIDYDPNAYQEPKPVPNGRYDLTIAAVEKKVSKNNNPGFNIRMEIGGHDDAPQVFHWLSIPYPGCEQMVGLSFNRFLALFKTPVSGGFDDDALAVELVGKTASAELVQEEYQGNISNKLVVPRLSSEGPGKAKPPSAKKAA